jgi:hypothetical protein
MEYETATSSTGVTYLGYSFCINNSTQWEYIDEMNALSGYQSDLAGTEMGWAAAWVLLILAIMTLFFCTFFLFYAIFDMDLHGQVRVSVLAVVGGLLILSVVLEVAVLLLVQTSQRTDPIAWTTNFFETCRVDITASTGYYFPVLCAAFGGAVLLVAAAAVLYSSRAMSASVSVGVSSGGGMGGGKRSEKTDGHQPTQQHLQPHPHYSEKGNLHGNANLHAQPLTNNHVVVDEKMPLLQRSEHSHTSRGQSHSYSHKQKQGNRSHHQHGHGHHTTKK